MIKLSFLYVEISERVECFRKQQEIHIRVLFTKIFTGYNPIDMRLTLQHCFSYAKKKSSNNLKMKIRKKSIQQELQIVQFILTNINSLEIHSGLGVQNKLTFWKATFQMLCGTSLMS